MSRDSHMTARPKLDAHASPYSLHTAVVDTLSMHLNCRCGHNDIYLTTSDLTQIPLYSRNESDSLTTRINPISFVSRAESGHWTATGFLVLIRNEPDRWMTPLYRITPIEAIRVWPMKFRLELFLITRFPLLTRTDSDPWISSPNQFTLVESNRVRNLKKIRALMVLITKLTK